MKKSSIIIATVLTLFFLFGGCDEKKKSSDENIPEALNQPIGARNIEEKKNPADSTSQSIYEPPPKHYKVLDIDRRFVLFVPEKMDIKAFNRDEIYFSRTKAGIEYLQRVEIQEKILKKGEKAKNTIVGLFESYKDNPGYTTTKSSRIGWPFVPGAEVWQVRGRWQANENRLEWLSVIAFEKNDRLLLFTARQDSTRFGIFDEFLMDLHDRMLPPPEGGFPVEYRKDCKTFPKTLPGSFVPADKMAEKLKSSKKTETDEKSQ